MGQGGDEGSEVNVNISNVTQLSKVQLNGFFISIITCNASTYYLLYIFIQSLNYQSIILYLIEQQLSCKCTFSVICKTLKTILFLYHRYSKKEMQLTFRYIDTKLDARFKISSNDFDYIFQRVINHKCLIYSYLLCKVH